MVIDKTLLDKWGYDYKMTFDSQDEEIILAEIGNLELFLDAIDNSDYLQAKKDILLAALCVLYYDNVDTETPYAEDEEKGRILNAVLLELEKRKELIKTLPDWLLGEYIRAIVYPAVGLK